MELIFLSFIALLGVVALGVCSVSVIRRVGAKLFIIRLIRSLDLAMRVLVNLVAAFLGLLAEGSKISENNDNLGDLPGDYNFRTRKFDNGTDPYGWYEEDL